MTAVNTSSAWETSLRSRASSPDRQFDRSGRSPARSPSPRRSGSVSKLRSNSRSRITESPVPDDVSRLDNELQQLLRYGNPSVDQILELVNSTIPPPGSTSTQSAAPTSGTTTPGRGSQINTQPASSTLRQSQTGSPLPHYQMPLNRDVNRFGSAVYDSAASVEQSTARPASRSTTPNRRRTTQRDPHQQSQTSLTSSFVSQDDPQQSARPYDSSVSGVSLSKIEDEVMQLRSQKDLLLTEIIDMQNKEEKQIQDTNRFRLEAERARADADRARNEAQSKDDMIESLKHALIVSEKQVDDALKAAEDLAQDRTRALNELDLASTKLRSFDQITRERDELRSDLQEVRSQAEQTKSSHVSAESKERVLSNQLVTLTQELSTQLQQATTDKEQLLATIVVLEAQLSQEKKDKSTMQSDHNAEARSITHELSAAQAQLKEMGQRLQDAERLRSEALAQLRLYTSAGTGPSTPGQSDAVVDRELDAALFGNSVGLPLPNLHVPSSRPRQLGASGYAISDQDTSIVQTELATTRMALQRLIAERDALAAELESHKRVSGDMKSLLQSNQMALSQVRAELARRSSGLSSSAPPSDLEVKLGESLRARELLLSEKEGLATELRSIQAQVHTVARERDTLRAELEQVREVNSDMQRLLTESQGLNSRLESDLSESNMKVHDLEKRLYEKNEALGKYIDAETRIVENSSVLLSENEILHKQLRMVSNLNMEIETVLTSPVKQSRGLDHSS